MGPSERIECTLLKYSLLWCFVSKSTGDPLRIGSIIPYEGIWFWLEAGAFGVFSLVLFGGGGNSAGLEAVV